MELTAEEALEEKTIDVGKIIYEPPFYLDVNSRLTMIYPMSLRDKVLSVETMLPQMHMDGKRAKEDCVEMYQSA